MPGCVFTIGPSGTIVFANEAACDVLGLGSYVGEKFISYFGANMNRENDDFYEVVLDAIRDKGKRHQGRFPFIAPGGARYVLFVTSSHMAYGEDGGESYLVVTCADVTAEEESERLRRESIVVFLSSIVLICGFVFVYSVWNYIGQPGEPSYLTRILEISGIFLGIFVYRHTSLTLSDLGLSTDNLAHNLKVDGLACLGIIAFFVLVKLIMMNVAPQAITHPEAFYDPSWVDPLRFCTYIFTAVIQEFLTRGIMQESLLHVITGPHSRVTSIVMSTLMFATLHLMYSPLFMLGAAVMLGVFGVIYLRQRSIWGLALIHFTFGMSAAMLGLI